MSLFGTLDTIPAAEVFRILGTGGKTGLLKVDLGDVRKQVVLDAGQPVFCSSGNPKEFLGQSLLARTSVTERDMHDAAQLQETTGCLLGEALVELGRITRTELDDVLHRKVEDSLHDILTWRRGNFEFTECAVRPESAPLRIATSWEAVIAAGERRAEEVERVHRAVPEVTVRFQVNSERRATGTARCADEVAVLELLARGLSAAEACQRLHAGDLEILGHIANLVQEGVLEPMRYGSAPRAPSTAETVERSAKLVRAGRSAEALAMLREAQSRDPRDQRLIVAFTDVETGIRQRAALSIGDPARARLCSVSLERLNAASLTPNEAFIASRLDGEWTVASVIRVCPFGELDALALIESMFRRGLLMTVMASAPEPEPIPVGVAAPVQSRAADHAAERAKGAGSNAVPGRRPRDFEPGPGGR